MGTPYDTPSREPEVSGWAAGGLAFAASGLILMGIFQVIMGIVAVADDEFFVKAPNYTFHLDVSTWGWIHLLLGVLVFLTGLALFSGAAWAGVGAIAIAMLQALNNFFFLPNYPLWSLLIIAIDMWIIWSLTRPGVLRS
jgi:hypothetical protein